MYRFHLEILDILWTHWLFYNLEEKLQRVVGVATAIEGDILSLKEKSELATKRERIKILKKNERRSEVLYSHFLDCESVFQV